MHSRRLACFILGLWLGGGLLVAWTAADAFRAVDRLLAAPSPEATLRLRALGPSAARTLLRYQASEQNRALFRDWEAVQLVGGSLFFFFLLFATRERKFPLITVLVMVVVVALQRFAVTPELVSLGRNIDFVPADMPSEFRDRFWILHSGYAGLEALKWGAALALAGRNVFSRRHGRSEKALDEFDLIDKPNHRHING
jgi:hypothetical protein